MKATMFSWMIALLLTLSLSHNAFAKLHGEAVQYKHGETALEGYFVYDDASTGKRPAILVFPDWMGVTDRAKKSAEQLASLGYAAFVVDMYGKSVRPKDDKAAGAEAGKYKKDRALMRARAQAAFNQLRSFAEADPARIGAIGYCFGGGVALELARSGADIKGSAVFHASLDTPTPADAKNIKGRVLSMHGADDPFAPKEQVIAFWDEMQKAKVNWEIDLYGNAVHSFTDQSAGSDAAKGAAYNEQADKRSWARMKLFFEEVFPR